ncbi:MAG: TetR/AcrR family transcriptional regulator [Opitutaceae bacterium]
MAHTKPDRRIARTQQSLHVALNSLILEKDYEATTIKDITGRANVGRSTFYAHHGSKDSLLLTGLHHLRTTLVAAQRASDGQPLGFSRTFFEHLYEYRELYQAIIGSESGTAVSAAIKRIVAELVAGEIDPKEDARNQAIPRDALIQFTVDVFFSILGWWLERNPKLPPAEVDAVFRRLVLPALASGGVA